MAAICNMALEREGHIIIISMSNSKHLNMAQSLIKQMTQGMQYHSTLAICLLS